MTGLLESMTMVFVFTYMTVWLGFTLFQRLAPVRFAEVARKSTLSARILLYGPAVVTGIVSTAVLLPSLTAQLLGAPDHCMVHDGGHHHHLCLVHPPHIAGRVVSLVPSAALVLVFVGHLTRFRSRLRRDDRTIETLRETSRESNRWADVRLLDQQEPIAMTVGRVRPVILLSTGLIDRSSEATLQTILAHERAHIRRRDNWSSLADRFMAGLWTSAYSEVLMGALSTSREMACDEAAAESVGSRATVARALLEVLSLKLRPGRVGMSVAGSAVEERIQHLLSPPRRGLRIEIVALLGLLAIPLIAHVPLHTFAEHLVTFLSH